MHQSQRSRLYPRKLATSTYHCAGAPQSKLNRVQRCNTSFSARTSLFRLSSSFRVAGRSQLDLAASRMRAGSNSAIGSSVSSLLVSLGCAYVLPRPVLLGLFAR
jgi:hypothetical protein